MAMYKELVYETFSRWSYTCNFVVSQSWAEVLHGSTTWQLAEKTWQLAVQEVSWQYNNAAGKYNKAAGSTTWQLAVQQGSWQYNKAAGSTTRQLVQQHGLHWEAQSLQQLCLHGLGTAVLPRAQTWR